MNVKPVFVIGPPRTGTTLLARLLAGADRVLSLSEPFHLLDILHPWALGLFYWRFQRRRDLHRLRLPSRCTPKRYLVFLQEMAGANGLRSLVIKEVFHELGLRPPFCNFELLDTIARGDAPLIAIIRHPCDTAVSTVGLLRWLLYGRRGCAVRLLWPSAPRFRDDREIVRWCAENWAHFAGWTRQRRLFVVRYEDLVESPARTLPRICDHVGLPFHQRMLNHHQHQPAAFGGIGDPKVLAQLDRPVHADSVGRGESLTPAQQRIVRGACGEVAAEFGYSF